MIRKRTPRELLEQKKRIEELHYDLVLRDYGRINKWTKYANGRLKKIQEIAWLYGKIYSARLLSFSAKRRLFEDWGMDCNPDIWENDQMPTERMAKREYLWNFMLSLRPCEIKQYRKDLEWDLEDNPVFNSDIKEVLRFVPKSI